MDVPVYSLAERDRRWALARKLMVAEDVDAPEELAAARAEDVYLKLVGDDGRRSR